jgi:hypothetical protein
MGGRRQGVRGSAGVVIGLGGDGVCVPGLDGPLVDVGVEVHDGRDGAAGLLSGDGPAVLLGLRVVGGGVAAEGGLGGRVARLRAVSSLLQTSGDTREGVRP